MPDYEDLILQRQEYYEILEDDPDTWIITPDEFMDIWEDKNVDILEERIP